MEVRADEVGAMSGAADAGGDDGGTADPRTDLDGLLYRFCKKHLPAPGSAAARRGKGGTVAPGSQEAGDVIFALLNRLGMVRGRLRDGLGWDVECPWMHEHSPGPAHTTGTAYWPGTMQGFRCHHGHCSHRKYPELAAWADGAMDRDTGGLFTSVAAMDFPEPAPARTAGGTGTWPTLSGFFDRLVFIKSDDLFLDLATGGLVTRPVVDLDFAAGLVGVPAAAGRGGQKIKPVAWFFAGKNLGRRLSVDAQIYWPGRERVFQDGRRRVVNTWTAAEGTGLRPVGDGEWGVLEWLALVDLVFGVEGPRVVGLVLDWMAAMIAVPEKKPGWHLVVHGGQGIGKDLSLQPLRAGVGSANTGTVNATGLHSPFNAWVRNKLVVVNELKTTTRGSATGSDQYNVLKELTENTNARVWINEKYQRGYFTPNLSGFVVTSNDEAAMALERDDRRFLVVDARDIVLWPEDRYARLAEWLANGGDVVCADWLRDRWDTMDAGRRAVIWGRAPATRGKAAMIAAGEDPLMTWMREQIELGVWGDLMTAADIALAVAAAVRSGVTGLKGAVTPHRWGRVLRALGGAKVYRGESVRLKSGAKVKLWAVREPGRFDQMGEPQLGQAYGANAGSEFDDDKVVNFKRHKKSDAPDDDGDAPV